MDKIVENTYNRDHFNIECNKIIEELTSSMNSSTVDRQLDCSIMKVQDILLNGSDEEKNHIFELVYDKFQFFIKKQIANLFVLNTDKDDLIQEATMCFYNSILRYDINRGAFIYFTRTYIKRNIWGLISKSRKHVKSNVTFVSIDTFSDDEGNNNYDDHLYYKMSNNENIEDTLVMREQSEELLDKMNEILTEKERKTLYLYLQNDSYETIASICGISEKSVDNSLHRAKSKMKKNYINNFI